MSSIEIGEASWLYVQQGRVLVIRQGPSATKWASIVEIVDQHRVLVDGPSSNKEYAAPRQVLPISAVTLTKIVIDKQPRSVGTGALRKLWEAQNIDEKIADNTHAKKRVQQQKRSNLSDFERFKVMRLKKQARFEVKKAAAKIKASA
ncbi:60S ribosomal protein L14-B [Cyphellophora attinorum]|uniref:60S ribosomal protein L14-B n=1 Tax=Cyphellophora attinorum TaxID=1664694 RepID=A0A0N1HEB2_9EURO|nr:60S ribosomal protein L14-B [Phialophora attinorum]KPI43266.1 60S ribosomal protein L14-B [Phialophora attinorum]